MPCGRPAFSANPVNKKYNSRYRNSENQNKLGGKLLELGRATGLVAMALFGFDVSLEAAHAADRLLIFKSAAWYALTDSEVLECLRRSVCAVGREPSFSRAPCPQAGAACPVPVSPPQNDLFLFVYITYTTYVAYTIFVYLLYLLCRWPDKKYVIICPPPVARKPPSEVKESKQAKRFAEPIIEITIGDKEPERVENQKGVMYYKYDLVFHYLLASLRRADGANSVTSTGIKTFNIFAGLGEHR